MYNIEYTTNNNIKKYKEQYKNLRHVRTGKEYKGIILIDKDNTFVGKIQVNIDNKFMVALEISPDYRNKGLATRLIKYAENNLHSNKLSVNKKNNNAINLYKKLNYKIYKETDTMYFMKK